MRLVFYTENFPYPLTEGGKVAQFYVLKQLALTHEVNLVTVINAADQHHVVDFQKLAPSVMVHTVYRQQKTMPQDFFTRIKRKIIWEIKKRLLEANEQLPITAQAYFLDPVPKRSEYEAEELQNIFNQLQPEIVQIDFTESADIALLLPSTCKKVLVLHDLRQMSVVQAALLTKTSALYTDYLKAYVATKEKAFLQLYDGIIAFSKDDAARLEVQGLANVLVSPFAVNTQVDITKQDEVKQLIFLGGDMHSPNLQAVYWFGNTAKKILAKNGIITKVIGKWKQENMDLFEDNEGVQFTGFVKDFVTECENVIMVVPLQMGSGIRTKILDAFACGIPVISTVLGIEGIEAEEGKHYLLAETEEDFMQHIDYLINDNAARHHMIEEAKAFVIKIFSAEAVATIRQDFFEKLLSST